MRRGSTTRRASSALVAVGFVAGMSAGLAGCSGDPDPTPTPTPTVAEETSPSPTPTPTPAPTPDTSVAPERPAAMDNADSAGAEAVAVYLLQLYPYVYATNDLTEWRILSHPECIFCASVIGNVEEQIANGHLSDGGVAEFESVTSTEVSTGFFNVVVTATQGPSNEYGPDGAIVEHSDGEHSVLTLVILWTGAGWSVRGVDVEAAPTP